MFSITKILLPVDFSERAQHAARFAVPVAEHFHSQLTLLHVSPPYEIGSGEAGFAMQAELTVQRRKRAQEQIDAFLAAEVAHVQVRRVLREGDPAHEIVDCARTESSDLVMMPTHGYGRFRRLLLGSVTAKVLHDVDCPVWTTAHAEALPTAAAPARFQHIVCAVDLGANSRRVLDWSTGFAAEFGAEVTLVHVLTALDPRTQGYQFSPEWRNFVVDSAEKQIAAVQEQAGTHVQVKLAEGPVAEMVCAAVQELSADLLVIGRASNAGILGRLTSQAYSFIRQSPCGVVSV